MNRFTRINARSTSKRSRSNTLSRGSHSHLCCPIFWSTGGKRHFAREHRKRYKRENPFPSLFTSDPLPSPSTLFLMHTARITDLFHLSGKNVQMILFPWTSSYEYWTICGTREQACRMCVNFKFFFSLFRYQRCRRSSTSLNWKILFQVKVFTFEKKVIYLRFIIINSVLSLNVPLKIAW